ncbi:MAG: ATP-dependent zinc metalloprotease FtsH [Endomicrobium sp.]|jgi:cell division protease FtsH|nr:ATP-dependent zinc metalloprotease FtsH [Endomicrobium sp.]
MKQMNQLNQQKGPWFFLFWIVLAVIIVMMFHSARQRAPEVSLEYSQFKQQIKAGGVSKVVVSPSVIKGEFRDKDGALKKFKTVPMEDPNLIKDMEDNKVPEFSGTERGGFWTTFLISWAPFLLLIGVWIWFLRGMAGGGKQAMSFGKSKAKLAGNDAAKTTFKDVAGCDEAKEELQEIIEFLKNPAKFQKLGGKIPKGVLLAGSPGTGKTLLAKAVAGEAGVPFFAGSGSDFVEMFVGVGASRVRDLFDNGRKHAPCLLFIDEIDAVGRQRFAGVGGGHDEREQTLNQLLVEMDGFDSKEGVIVIAATNRPDVLDAALLRPGRFDRQIYVPQPDIKDREQILGVHVRNVKMDKDVNLNVIARRTPGFVGADLANVVNEAALLAARKNQETVTMKNFEDAVERVMAGPEKKSRVFSEHEKRVIAYHEAGHTVVGKFLPNTDPVHKVSIISRGQALGYTLHLPTEDKFLHSRTELMSRISVLFGGRVAEELVFADITSGASNDISRATNIATSMVTELGMSDKLGLLVTKKPDGEVFLGRDLGRESKHSEKISELVDSEIKNIIDGAQNTAKKILTQHRDKLDKLAGYLLERETLNAEEINKIINGQELEPLAKEELPNAQPPSQTQHQDGENKQEPSIKGTPLSENV